MSNTANSFRTDINGLRAIAVLSVVFYHFNISLFSSGFVGVDIFFVISGFLMTGIILRRLAGNNFSLSVFFLDRCIRIFPALIVLCVFLLLFGWFWLIPADYEVLGKHVASSLSFISNFIYWQETGFYGDLASHDKWLLHTWSLSVEWQFYIFLPIFIVLFKKLFTLKYLFTILGILSLLSLLLSSFTSQQWPSPSFYLLPTRAWELCAGACIYALPRAEKFSRIFEVLGLVLILISVFLIGNTNGWPGYRALVPVTGAMLIIYSNIDRSIFTSNTPFQLIGSASYSIYLWHWPIVVWLNYKGLLENHVAIGLGISASVLLGYISLIAVENPTRKKLRARIKSPAVLLTLIVSVAAMVGCLGYFVYFFKGFSGESRKINLDQRSIYLQKYRDLKDHTDDLYRLQCSFLKRSELGSDCSAQSKPNGIFLWGDSHAQHLAHGIIRLLDDKSKLAQVTTSGCGPAIDKMPTSNSFKEACDKSNLFALEEISRLRPKLVILAQKDDHQNTDWTSLAGELKKRGAQRVVLIGPVPQWHPSLPAIIVRRHWNEMPTYIDDGLIQDALNTDFYLKSRLKDANEITYLSMIDALCKNRKCLATVPNTNVLTAIDYGHFSAENSVYVADKLLKPIISETLGN